MTTAVLDINAFPEPAHAVGRTAAALRSLMQSWEQEVVVEEEESEAELMVMLSGMVGSHATALGDD
jgi:hypothetical protein